MQKYLLLFLLVSNIACGSNDNSSTCSISNCHGLTIECDYVENLACTEEYQLGDRCRQYAECQEQNGTCQVVLASKFTSCVECVQNCQNLHSNPELLFDCEARCG